MNESDNRRSVGGAMYPHDPAEARAHRDVAFNSLVGLLEMFLHRHEFSPSELREAVILAATRYEMKICRPMFMLKDEEVREFLARTGRDAKGEEEIDRLKYVEAVLANPELAAELLRERGGR